MLLFGPPSCGKTLIARQIGNILNPREPKIVNGSLNNVLLIGMMNGKELIDYVVLKLIILPLYLSRGYVSLHKILY